MKRLSIGAALFALVIGGVLAGCGSQDTGTVEANTPETRAKAAEMAKQQLEAIKNNPKIPEAQKQAILARMGGAAGQGEANMRNKMVGQSAPTTDPPKK